MDARAQAGIKTKTGGMTGSSGSDIGLRSDLRVVDVVIEGTLVLADGSAFAARQAASLSLPFSGQPDAAPKVTLAQLSNEIFTPRCAVSFCHSGGSPASGMSLAADRIAAQILNVDSVENSALKRVEPGNPDDSYLLRKVQGRNITGGQMPADGTALSAEEIEKIRQWIAAGAPE